MPSKSIAKARCPMCGLSRVVLRKGTGAAKAGRAIKKGLIGLFHFGEWPIDDKETLYFVASHGRTTDPTKKSGFQPVGEGMTLRDIVGNPVWKWLSDDIYRRASEIVKEIDDARRKRNRG